MYTISDIAKKAGVTKSTVSKALNNGGDINPETARRIRKIAAEAGYEKRPRKRAENKILGIVCPEIDDAFYSQMINGLVLLAGKEGYTCVTVSNNFDFGAEKKSVEYLTEKNVAGIFIVNAEVLKDYNFYDTVKECNVPIVRVSADSANDVCDNIWINEKAGIDDAISHLISFGHGKVAFLGDCYGKFRLSCLKQAMEERGLEFDEELCVLDWRRFESGYNGVKKLLAQKKPFTAIFAQYDDVALGAVKALKENDLSVPEDVSVIGFDDAHYCEYVYPPLTTINSKVNNLCEVAFALMKNKISGKNKAVQFVLVKPELVVRGSVTKAKSFETKK